MFNPVDFKRVVKASGLTAREIGLLYGITRQTVGAWQRGAPPREGTPMDRSAVVITNALLQSMAKGVLPLAAMDRSKRAEYVRRMAKVLRNLKLAPVE